MTGNAFTGQGKKLIVIGLFLALVALLVGGEDDPGMIANLAAPNSFDAARPDTAELAPAPAAMPSRKAPPRREDPSLSSWYAHSESTGAVEPQPVQPAAVDNSHLINDAKPLVSTGPGTPPSGIVVEDPAPAMVE